MFRPSLLLLALSAVFAGVNAAPWFGPVEVPCSAQVDALVAGIQINILGQRGERNATEVIQAIEAAVPYNATAFAAGKAVLLSDIAFGMQIREYNQRLAPPGNAAIPGLAKVGVGLEWRSSRRCRS